MEIGKKIKYIRTMRNITQKELGIAVGLPKANADVRIAQYEAGTRVPKEKLCKKFAEVLEVHPQFFRNASTSNFYDVLYFLFHVDKIGITDVNLEVDEETLETGEIKRHAKISLPLYDRELSEWYDKKVALKNNEITEEEYYDWMWNYPHELNVETILDDIGPFLIK